MTGGGDGSFEAKLHTVCVLWCLCLYALIVVVCNDVGCVGGRGGDACGYCIGLLPLLALHLRWAGFSSLFGFPGST
jgi:hypothetical protein